MAASIFSFSLVFAAAMSMVIGVLIYRRWRYERLAPVRTQAEREATRRYLQRLSEPNAPGAVLDNAEVRLHAATHLSRLLRGGEREALVRLVEQEGLLDGPIRDLRSQRIKRRAAALQVVENFASERCVQALRSLMANEPNSNVQLEAASALARLGRLPPPRDTISLLGLENAGATGMHLALFRSLAPIHPRDMAELAQEVRLRRLRPLLVEALGWTSDPSATFYLAEHSRDPDPDVRCGALAAAVHAGHPGAAEWVLPRLDDSEASVRAAAVEAVRKLGLTVALPTVRRLERDPAAWVAAHAERASVEMSGGLVAAAGP